MNNKLTVQTSIEEKVVIANHIYNSLYDRAFNKLQYKINKITKLNRFPYYFINEYNTVEYGKWEVILTIFNKPKKGNYNIGFDAYQPYIINNAKNIANNGLGLFHICAMGFEPATLVRFDEYAPHLFNRMHERSNIEILGKTIKELILYMQQLTSKSMIINQPLTKKIDDKNNMSCDCIINIQNGQYLGTCHNMVYYCMKTYISENEMKSSQFALNNINNKFLYNDDLINSGIWHINPEILSELLNDYDNTTINDIKNLYKGDKKMRYSENVAKFA